MHWLCFWGSMPAAWTFNRLWILLSLVKAKFLYFGLRDVCCGKPNDNRYQTSIHGNTLAPAMDCRFVSWCTSNPLVNQHKRDYHHISSLHTRFSNKSSGIALAGAINVDRQACNNNVTTTLGTKLDTFHLKQSYIIHFGRSRVLTHTNMLFFLFTTIWLLETKLSDLYKRLRRLPTCSLQPSHLTISRQTGLRIRPSWSRPIGLM